jgi:HK97 family phage major capsid protein
MPDEKPNETAPEGGPRLTHTQTVNRQREITSEMERIGEIEAPTPEDETYFEELRGEFFELDVYRKKLERQAKLDSVREVAEGSLRDAARAGARRPSGRVENGQGDWYDKDSILEPDSIEEKRFRNPWKLDEMRTYGRGPAEIAGELRARALSAVEQMQVASDNIRSAATDIIERFDDEGGNLSRLALTLSEPVYLRAWSKMARDPQAPDLTDDERQSIARVKSLARAMSLTDTAGGYLVPFQLDPTVILTSAGSRNDIRQAARQVVATGDVWHGVSAGAVSWGYRAEAAEAGDDSPTFAQPTVPIYTADGFVPISMEALADASNIAAEVGALLAQGKDDLEAVTFATGDGSGKPTGIVTALVAGSATVSAGTDGTFALADVYKVHDAVPARYRGRPSAAWLANNQIYSKIRQFDTAGGAGLWAQLGENRPLGMMGRPVLEAEAMDGVIDGSANNYVLIFGDFSNYVIADRIGTTVEFIPHLFGNSNRPTGQRGWYAYVRHGADSVNDAGFKLLDV